MATEHPPIWSRCISCWKTGIFQSKMLKEWYILPPFKPPKPTQFCHGKARRKAPLSGPGNAHVAEAIEPSSPSSPGSLPVELVAGPGGVDEQSRRPSTQQVDPGSLTYPNTQRMVYVIYLPTWKPPKLPKCWEIWNRPYILSIWDAVDGSEIPRPTTVWMVLKNLYIDNSWDLKPPTSTVEWKPDFWSINSSPSRITTMFSNRSLYSTIYFVVDGISYLVDGNPSHV